MVASEQYSTGIRYVVSSTLIAPDGSGTVEAIHRIVSTLEETDGGRTAPLTTRAIVLEHAEEETHPSHDYITLTFHTDSYASQVYLLRKCSPDTMSTFAGLSLITTDGSLCPDTTSAVDAVTASGYHLLAVEGYIRTKLITPNGRGIASRPFIVGGHRWRIHYCPNGKISEDSDFISLQVACDGDDVASQQRTVKMQLECSFIDQIHMQDGAYVHASKILELPSDLCVSFPRFMKRENFEKSRHLKADRFTIRCDLVVVDGDDPASPAVVVPPSGMWRHLSDLLLSGEGADVTFEVGGEKFAAHRLMLAARSTVFRTELLGPMKEGAASTGGVVVRIDDMEARVFGALLRFIYTDSSPELEMVDDDDECLMWQHLLVGADRYDLQRLRSMCEDKLCEHIGVATVTTILALAEQHHCRGLREACLEFLTSPGNLQKVKAMDGLDRLIACCPGVIKDLILKLASRA